VSIVSLGAKGLSRIPFNSPPPPSFGGKVVPLPSSPPLSPLLLPPSGKKCQFFVLRNARFTIFVLNAVMTVKVTGYY
jgi:hypothetical protein